jgi:hypothetical protein
MTAFAHQFARLIGPFHGEISAARPTVAGLVSARRS